MSLKAFIARVAFYAVVALSLTWTASLTYSFVSKALPEIGLAAALSLIVFDGGMVAWLLIFLWGSQGVGQRGIAVIGSLLDFVGVGLMVVAEIFLGGQTFAAAPPRLGEAALWGIGLWTVGNVGLAIVFHLLDPEAREQMAMQSVKDRIKDSAIAKLEGKAAEEGERVADQLATTMKDDAIRELIARKPRKETANGRAPAAAQESGPSPKGKAKE